MLYLVHNPNKLCSSPTTCPNLHVNMQFIKSGSLILTYSLLSPYLALYDWYLQPWEQE